MEKHKFLKEFIEKDKNRELNIAVIGDAMLDQYHEVQVKKLSPEFPIPIISSESIYSTTSLPGGAANVVYQCKHFNVRSVLASFIDSEAKLIYDMCNVKTDLSVNLPHQCKIPRKKRFYTDNYPLYRWDIEKPNYGLKTDLCKELYNKIKADPNHYDAFIFSDYNKGVFANNLCDLIKEVPISIVDPKPQNFEKWKGCTIFKPNEKEALEMSPYNDIESTGFYLRDKLECQAVVITQSGNGVSVFNSEKMHVIKPTKKIDNVQSVIGAGDCFTMFLTIAILRNYPFFEAAEIAWNAGLLYVKNCHNKPLTKKDFIDLYSVSESKIIKPADLVKRDYKLVFTNGCFDGGLTPGHIHCLQFAKNQGDKLVVAINDDDSVKRLKGSERPFLTLQERVRMIASLEMVDYVVSFKEDTPYEVLEIIKPNLIIKGGDYSPDKVVGNNLAEVIICPLYECNSTTEKFNNSSWKNHIEETKNLSE